jgi:hypothetical protein
LKIKLKAMKYLIGFLLIMFSFQTIAQSVKGTVKDSETNATLVGVNVFIDGSTIGTTTDENGYFEITPNNYPFVLTISYLGYERRKITFITLSDGNLDIELSRVASNLPEAVVRSKPKIDTIYREPYSVIDYDFFDKYILLLVYRGFKKRYSVLLMTPEGEIFDEHSLGQSLPVGFFRGCLGAIYFLTGDAARQIYIQDEKIYFYKSVALQLFEQSAYNCILSANDYVYFRDYYMRGQMLNYYRIRKDSKEGERQKFALIIDEERARMADDEARFERMKDDPTAFKPMGIGEMMGNSAFVSRVIFEPIYAPIYQLSDSIIVFNLRKNRIEFYNQPEKITKTVKIDFQNSKKWKKEIIRDEDTENFYTLYDTRWGYLIKKLNLQTGQSIDLIELDRAFITNVKIKAGYVYFLESNLNRNDQITKLQKMRIE